MRLRGCEPGLPRRPPPATGFPLWGWIGIALIALGWALARAGRCSEAERWLDRALRLGTKDALLFFHRGYAAGCSGDRAGMLRWYRNALAQSPAFSVRWAPVARKAVS